MLTWTPALTVGVPELDAQHQELFRRADAFLEGLQTCSALEVSELMSFLREHALAHFGAEERWMREAGYPDLEAHANDHSRFLEELDARAAAAIASAGAGASPLGVAQWLVRWLHDHIARSDTAAARCISGDAVRRDVSRG